jgi:hypothetical protein
MRTLKIMPRNLNKIVPFMNSASGHVIERGKLYCTSKQKQCPKVKVNCFLNVGQKVKKEQDRLMFP